MDSIESTDNITEELTKLLDNTKSKKNDIENTDSVVEKNNHNTTIESLLAKIKFLENKIKKFECEKDGSSDEYKECLDKILAAKLDELSVRVDNKLNELNKFTTRDSIASRHR